VNNRNSNQYLSHFHFESGLVSINILQDCLSVLLFCPKNAPKPHVYQNRCTTEKYSNRENLMISKTSFAQKYRLFSQNSAK